MIHPDDPIAPVLNAMAERDARMEAIATALQARLDGVQVLTAADAAKLAQGVGKAAAAAVRDEIAGLARAQALRAGLIIATALLATALTCLAAGYALGGRRVMDICRGEAVRQAEAGRYCVFWLDR